MVSWECLLLDTVMLLCAMEMGVATLCKFSSLSLHDIYSNTASLNGWLFVWDLEVRLVSTNC